MAKLSSDPITLDFSQAGFSHCPRCGEDGLGFRPPNRYHCSACDFHFYMNTAAACGAILTIGSRILLLRRGKEPALGMLDFPGGFIDPGESAEAALVREVQEEIRQIPTDLQFLVSFPNRYEYGGVAYPTCDLIFTGRLPREPKAEDLQTEEIAGWVLLEVGEVDLESIAFPSLRRGLQVHQNWWKKSSGFST